MTTVEKEVENRIKAKREAQKATRELLTFSISSYNLNNFQIIEQVQNVYAQVQRVRGDYEGMLKEEDKKVTTRYNETLNNIVENIKDISDNVLLDVQNALMLAYNEGANVINNDESTVNYKKISAQIENSQGSLIESTKKISENMTELSVYRERFTGENGKMVATKITQICEELLSLLATDSARNDVALSLVALQTLSEVRN